jgi:hypothetical protein
MAGLGTLETTPTFIITQNVDSWIIRFKRISRALEKCATLK